MKNILAITTVLLGLMSCEKNAVDKQDDTDRIQYKETVALTPSGSLTFADVSDSRCPEGVQCVWAGNVVVDLELKATTGTKNEAQTIKMCLGDCSPLYPSSGFRETDTARFVLSGTNHTLILTDVSPYPKANQSVKKEDYSINLEID